MKKHYKNSVFLTFIVVWIVAMGVPTFVVMGQQPCPTLPGGTKSIDFQSSGLHRHYYPGGIPLDPGTSDNHGQATSGTFHVSNKTDVTLETPVLRTIVPHLNGNNGVVVFQILRLSIPVGGVVRIYEGGNTSGTEIATINSNTQDTEVGKEYIVNGAATVTYEGPTGTSDESTAIRFFTGDIQITSCRNRTVAMWSEFITANSNTLIDDYEIGLSGASLPGCMIYFDENKNYTTSETSFCLDYTAGQPTPSMGYYPGQITFVLQSTDGFNINKSEGPPDEEDDLIIARILWLINEAKSISDPNTLYSIQIAIWVIGETIEPEYANDWVTDAETAVPKLQDPPEPDPFSIALAEDEQSSVVKGASIWVDIQFNVPEDEEKEVNIVMPPGVTVAEAIGAQFHSGSGTLDNITASTVKLRLTSDNIVAGAIQVVYDQDKYYNIQNLNIYIPCNSYYQPFFHVGEKNLPRPFRSIELEWTEDPLPVSLVSFKATAESNNVNLVWKTANETDFSHFEVEKSLDAKIWNRFARIKGNNSGFYSTTDSDFPSALTYYRLKMVDLDGSFAYSPIERIISRNIQGDFAYPNPAANKLFFTRNNGQKVQIYNASGRVVVNSISSDQGVDVSGLNTGIYLAVLRLENGTTLTQRFIKQ